MSFLRPSTMFIRISRQIQVPQASLSFVRPLSYSQHYRDQGYGDGKGDPQGEKPQEQGESNSAQHNAEHPGPAPPPEGQGTGGATKAAGQKKPEDASAQSGGSRSKEAKEKGSSPTAGSVKKGTRSYHTTTRKLYAVKGTPEKEAQKAKGPDGAKPKILDSKMPGGGIDKISKEEKAKVEEHNRDFEKSHDRPAEQDSEKVDPKFWKGK